jgi:hypothetical protein
VAGFARVTRSIFFIHADAMEMNRQRSSFMSPICRWNCANCFGLEAAFNVFFFEIDGDY